MNPGELKQEFSLTFLHAIVTAAGYALHVHKIDLDSVDVTIAAGRNLYARRPRLDVQLKCTDLGDGHPGDFSYPLKVKNYNDLRDTDPHVPIILVVVTIPKNSTTWIKQHPLEMVLQESAYWIDGRIWPPTKNKKGIRITIPRARQFNEQVLRTIMSQIEQKSF